MKWIKVLLNILLQSVKISLNFLTLRLRRKDTSRIWHHPRQSYIQNALFVKFASNSYHVRMHIVTTGQKYEGMPAVLVCDLFQKDKWKNVWWVDLWGDSEFQSQSETPSDRLPHIQSVLQQYGDSFLPALFTPYCTLRYGFSFTCLHFGSSTCFNG